MSNLYESRNYDVSYRAILTNKETVKVFTEKDFIEVTSEVEFDSEKSQYSSLNYFASSIVGGIIHSLKNTGKRSGIFLGEIEGKIKIKLKNPLTLLGVKGYEEEPVISECSIIMYIYSELDDEEIIKFCEKALKYCYIYNTVKKSINTDIKFLPII